MALNPIPLVVVLLLTYVFTFGVAGDELIERRFDFGQPEGDSSQDCEGLFDGFVCGIENFINFIRTVFTVIWGVIGLIFDLATFNVAGAPFFIRFLVGGFTVTTFGWSLATLLRGN